MYPIIVKVGSVTIYSHGLMIIAGVLLGTWALFYLAEKLKLSRSSLVDNISSTVLFGIIGARLAYVILNYNELTSFWQAFYIWQGGLVSWGGFVVGGLTLAILLRSQKQALLPWLDILSLSTLLGIAVGRIGCALTGDIAGRVSQRFPAGFPVAATEAVLAGILFVALLMVFFRFKNLAPGMLMVEVWFGYALIRLVVDTYRDEKAFFIGLNPSQFTALIVLAGLTAYLLHRLLMQKKFAKSGSINY